MNPRRFLKIYIPPRLSPDLQQFAFRFGMLAVKHPDGVRADQIGPGSEAKLERLDELGLVERTYDGLWRLAENQPTQVKNVGACAVLPMGDAVSGNLRQKFAEMFRMGLRLFIQLNGYLLLAVLIAMEGGFLPEFDEKSGLPEADIHNAGRRCRGGEPVQLVAGAGPGGTAWQVEREAVQERDRLPAAARAAPARAQGRAAGLARNSPSGLT